MMNFENMDNRTYKLLFGIVRSIRYHRHRESFFRGWMNTMALFSVVAILGLYGILAAVDSSMINAELSIFVWYGSGICFSCFMMVYCVLKIRKHKALADRFVVLEKQFSSGQNLNDQHYHQIANEQLDIETLEPTVLRLLDVICHYEVLQSISTKQLDEPGIPLWRRILASYISQLGYVQSLLPKLNKRG